MCESYFGFLLDTQHSIKNNVFSTFILILFGFLVGSLASKSHSWRFKKMVVVVMVVGQTLLVSLLHWQQNGSQCQLWITDLMERMHHPSSYGHRVPFGSSVWSQGASPPSAQSSACSISFCCVSNVACKAESSNSKQAEGDGALLFWLLPASAWDILYNIIL